LINFIQDKNKGLLSSSENLDIFLEFWELQLKTFLDMKKVILIGLTQEKQEIDEDDSWLGFESLNNNLDEEDDD
jgi:hypothetical protein